MEADSENRVATETTPLMGNGTTDDRGILLGEPAPLGDIKEHTILERVVGAGAAVGCTLKQVRARSRSLLIVALQIRLLH